MRNDHDGLIKIGATDNLTKRLNALRSANSSALTLIATMPADRWPEAALHDRFAHIRIRGEWFQPTAELLDFLEQSTDRTSVNWSWSRWLFEPALGTGWWRDNTVVMSVP